MSDIQVYIAMILALIAAVTSDPGASSAVRYLLVAGASAQLSTDATDAGSLLDVDSDIALHPF